MKDFEELKKAWQHTPVNIGALGADPVGRFAATGLGRASSSQQKLARHYLRSFIFSLLAPLFAPALVCVLGLPLWVAILYAVFGIAMAVVNFRFRRFILHYDFLSQPIVSALSSAILIARRQRIIRSISLTVATMLCLTIAATMLNVGQDAGLAGMCAGLVLGGIIAIQKVRNTNDLVRSIQTELRSVLNDGEIELHQEPR